MFEPRSPDPSPDPPPRELDCSEVQARLEAYVDANDATEASGATGPGDSDDSVDSLEVSERRAIASHLATCARCRGEHRLALDIRTALRGLPEAPCPDAVVERVFAEVDAESSPPRGTRLLAAAAILAALLGAAALLRLDRFPARTASLPEPAAAEPTAADSELPSADVGPVELARAEAEARLAFAYLAAVTRRAGETLRDDVLLDQVLAAPRRAFDELGRSGRGETGELR